MTDDANDIPWSCPRCRATVERHNSEFVCEGCESRYPIVEGIADFRIYPDPYIGLEADREKGRALAKVAATTGFDELVRYYYSITPEVPPDLAEVYTAHHLAGTERARGMIERFERYGLGSTIRTDATVLDAGCGTGGFLAEISPRVGRAIGVDIAFRWLVVARKRLDETGRANAVLVCACADALPLPDGFADLVVGEGLLEHVEGDPAKVIGEIGRVCGAEGEIALRTVNRFAPGPEPHVGVWGVGFLPHRWMDGWVRARKGIPYEHIHLRSSGEMRRAVKRAGIEGMTVRWPLLLPADYAHHSRPIRAALASYAWLARWCPPLRPILRFFGPYLDLFLRRR